LYPEAVPVAEVSGATVLDSSRPLSLQSTWEVRGAFMSFVAKGFRWSLNRQEVGTGTSLQRPLATGEHVLEVQHDDFLNRTYRFAWTLHVLNPQVYTRRVVAPLATRALSP
jgi:hypothetical protein